MKKKNSDSKITKWIKRLFSVNSLMLIVAVFTAYIAVITLVQSKPGSLDYYISKSGDVYKIDNNIMYLSCITDYVDELSDDVPIIRFVNKERNAITNLNVEISAQVCNVVFSDDYIIKRKINGDEDVENGVFDYSLKLKKNYLESGNYLSFPITEIVNEDELAIISLKYNIFYDGLGEPIKFEYGFININREIDESLLKTYYDNHNFNIIFNQNPKLDYENVAFIFKDTIVSNIKGRSYLDYTDPNKPLFSLSDIGDAEVIEYEEEYEASSFFGKVKEYINYIFK